MAKKPRPEDLLDWIGLTDAPDWRLARPYGRLIGFVLSSVLIFVPILVVCALIAAFVVVLGTAHQVWTGAGGPNLGAGALIAAILGAPFVIWGTVIKHRQLGFQKEGHITDRISKAVEQLGAEKVVRVHRRNKEGTLLYEDGSDSKPDFKKPIITELTEPNIEVRIGGLLSLERISQDSLTYDKGRDYVRVMEVLCAYIRNNAPAESHEENLDEVSSPRSDIMIAMNILGKRPTAGREVEAATRGHTIWKTLLELSVENKPADNYFTKIAAALKERNSTQKRRYRLDLRSCDLSSIVLENGDWSNTDFSGSVLRKAKLRSSVLLDCNFFHCDMRECSIDHCNLSFCTFADTNFGQSFWSFSQFIASSFSGGRLPDTPLSSNKFLGSKFEGMSFHISTEIDFLEDSYGDGSNRFYHRYTILPLEIAPPVGWATEDLGLDIHMAYFDWLNSHVPINRSDAKP